MGEGGVVDVTDTPARGRHGVGQVSPGGAREPEGAVLEGSFAE
jgi:hypothetical protein